MTAPVPFLARLAADAGDMRVGPGTIAPVQRPASPVRRAANSGKTVARAARLADTWPVDPHATLQTTTQQVALFHAARADAGRGPGATLPAITEAFCARDRATALELAGPARAGTFRVPGSWAGPGAARAGERQRRPRPARTRPLRHRLTGGAPGAAAAVARAARGGHVVLRTRWSGLPVDAALGSIRLPEGAVPVLRAAPGGGES
ncbi:MAG: Luciferase-like, subgroup [Modestobacter sp.]|nr:Luciferase-like, subgroup [Modestobacter sp.]